MAPDFTVTGLLPWFPSTKSVPALIAVVPVYVLAALTSSVPAPFLVKPTEPEITPPTTSVAAALSTVTVPGLVRSIGKLTVLVPVVCEASIEVKDALLPPIE